MNILPIRYKNLRNKLSIFNFQFSTSSGFTLLELLVVISMIAILSGVGFASFATYSREQAVEQAAQQFKTAIEQAKFSALSRVKPSACNLPVGDYSANICYLGAGLCQVDGGGADSSRRLFEVSVDYDTDATSGISLQECASLTSGQFPSNVQFSNTAGQNTCGGTIGFKSLTGEVHNNNITSGALPSLSPSPCRVVITGFNNAIQRSVCIYNNGSTRVLKGIATC